MNPDTVMQAATVPELEAAGLPPTYECAYNHTTLQVLRVDQHHEFARMHGDYATFAILLVRWKGAQRQYELIREIESQGGCVVINPHVVTIEDGGMKTIDSMQVDFKKLGDPMGLMNPCKTRSWQPAMARQA